jgi:probable addiction module antidote protein
MNMESSKWDLAEGISTKEDFAAHLTVAIEENDIEFFFAIIRALPRSKGMAALARELGVSREGLYTSLAPDGNPNFATVSKLLITLGFRLRVEQKIPA